jgi:hypothetical protein
VAAGLVEKLSASGTSGRFVLMRGFFAGLFFGLFLFLYRLGLGKPAFL